MSQKQITIYADKIVDFNLHTSNNENKPKKRNHPLIFNLPEPVDSFGGRDNELSELHKSLDAYKIVVLTGMAGMGKSELAKVYALTHIEHYQSSVIWINSETNNNITESFRQVAKEVSVKVKGRLMNCILQEIYSNFKESIVLIIFDNVIDQTSIRTYLPSKLQQDIKISVIITSQNRSWTGNVKLIELLPFSEDAAINLFAAVLKDKFHSCHREIWKDIARCLDFLPLFLQTSAAYFIQETDGSNPGFTISQYLTRLQTEEHLLLNNSLPDYNNRTIIAAMQLTLGKIKNVSSIQLINVCSFLDPSHIDMKTILKILNETTKNDNLLQAIRIVSGLSLITFKGERIRIHRLVQRILRQLQRKDDINSRFFEKALNLVVYEDDLFLHRRSVFQYAEEHIDIVYNLYKKDKSFRIIRLLTAYGCVKILELIFSKMFTIKIKLKVKKHSLLYEAASSGDLDTFKLIFKYCKDINQRNKLGWTPLRASIEGGHEHITNFLVENGASVTMTDEHKITQLHEAAECGNIEILRFLLGKASNVDVKDAEGYTPLIYAVLRGHTEAIRLFIDKGAIIDNIDSAGRTPLHYASELMDTDTVRLLLEQPEINLDVQDVNGCTPLHDSAIGGYLKVAKLLLGSGANINVKDNDGMTPLHWAAFRKHTQVLELLLENENVKISETDSREQTALHCAAFTGSNQVINILIEKGCSMYDRDKDGRSPFHYAVLRRHFYVVQNFIKQDPFIVHQTDRDGQSALHFAAKVNSTRIVQLLLAKGAVINCRDIRNRTPLDTAQLEDSEDAENLLRELSLNYRFSEY